MPRLEPEYEIQLSEVAEKVYERLYLDAETCLARGDRTNSKVKQFRMIEEVLDKIIPHDPFAPERALSGKLSGIYRIKKGRMRICYIGNAQEKVVRVIFISDTPRKAGDKNDPYSLLTKMVHSGNHKLLEELGVEIPLRRTILSAASAFSVGTIQ